LTTPPVPTLEAFTIVMPAGGWTAELLTTPEKLDSMVAAYQGAQGRRPEVMMCPATWAIAALVAARPWARSTTSALQVVLAEAHDPLTITVFDDDLAGASWHTGAP
jgi:hypothetical protein